MIDLNPHLSKRLNGTLIFTNKGELLFSMDDQKYIPLSLMSQIQDNENKDLFILKYMESEVLIEEGTTLANFFIALKPWSKVLSIYTDRDFDLYIDECRKPIEMKKSKDDDFKCIVLKRKLSLSRHINFVFEEGDEDNTSPSFYNTKHERVKTNKFCADEYISAEGETHLGDEYSIMTNFDDIKFLPVLIDENEVINFSEDFNVIKDTIKSSPTSNTYYALRENKNNLTLREVIMAIVVGGLFFKTPKGLENFNNNLNKDIEDFNLEDYHLHNDNNDDDDNFEVIIEKDAFDGLKKAIAVDDDIWQELLSKAYKDKSHIPVIGKFKLSKRVKKG